MGVKEHQFSHFRGICSLQGTTEFRERVLGMYYQYSFSVDSWCDGPLEEFTFRTERGKLPCTAQFSLQRDPPLVPFSFEQAKAFRHMSRVRKGYGTLGVQLQARRLLTTTLFQQRLYQALIMSI